MAMDTCKLCLQNAELLNSHILPAFVFRWLKESAGNGHIRFGQNPNQRVQDGIKRYWLCASCEELFNRSETIFANDLFYPYLEASGKQFHYSRWLLHFCTSLSWRVLKLYLEDGHLKDWDEVKLNQIIKAELVWREFLLGKRPHPDSFRQHLLPLDQIQSTTGKVPPNINCYIMRAIDTDVCQGSDSIFTYVKLGRFIILGFIHEPNPNRWQGSKVNANKGIIEPKQYLFPRAFGEYLNKKAKRAAELLNSVSNKQQNKIDSAFRANVDNYIGSDAFQAMLADINMFGDKAFSERKD
jgi:hypothetical protein